MAFRKIKSNHGNKLKNILRTMTLENLNPEAVGQETDMFKKQVVKITRAFIFDYKNGQLEVSSDSLGEVFSEIMSRNLSKSYADKTIKASSI